ncbi:NAD(P)H-binding protein [Streptomyces sp. ML-6]|uniref:NAD(P)H-binding protein n=1 Tax=Streptomyces sp. ML-6 TaxID=2982693 RepID=UPI0024BF5AAB|nr:NAD(P)H-binding protein [Streptomyces sp. ML-6]MDK0524552.1 NAD(P)H-binding protein [Streptomyces sp. ML-6]
MILVTGATGTVGREVVRSFPAGAPLRLMTRNPAQVTGVRPGAEVVAGDYADPGSLARVLRGVRGAFLVTNRVGGDDDAVFLRAARTAGVRHVVKLSAAAVADERADDLITCWQRTNEDLLRGSGMDWTLLRPRSFMSNCLSWAGSIRSERVVRALYGTSVNACVDPRDIAEVAVCALTDKGHCGAVHTLTGPEAISAVEQTDRLARALGVPLRFEELEPEQARAALLRRYPEELADALLGSARRQRDGAKAAVGGGVAEVTGRPARRFDEWAGDHVTAFAPGTSS